MTKEIEPNGTVPIEIIVESMDFKVLTRNDLIEIMGNPNTGEWNVPLTTAVNGRSKFMGFEYFAPKNLLDTSVNLRFLVCIVNKDIIAGVLLLADCEAYGKEYVKLSYIDVHEKFRRRGIAKGLYRLLNSYLPKDTLFISSHLSAMGRKANLDRLRKSIVTNFITYDSLDDYNLCSMYEFYKTS